MGESVRLQEETCDVNKNDFLGQLDVILGLPQIDLREFSPLVLAYIGDAVYELAIRTMLVKTSTAVVSDLNNHASQLAKAPAQARAIERIMPLLTEEEEQIYRRGRNAKSYTRAKNASMIDYRKATGFEALMGYLYLKKDTVRMLELMELALHGKKRMRDTQED